MSAVCTRIIVRFQFEATHQWPEAPPGSENYLRFPHRHEFYVEAVKDVNHDNRDVEFIRLKRDMRAYVVAFLNQKPQQVLIDLGSLSCEMIAMRLLNAFTLKSCRVFEDNENGAEVESLKSEIPAQTQV